MSDTISRQAAIDAVREHCEKYRTYPIAEYDVEIILNRLPTVTPSAQPDPQWIPCSERLPEDLEEVNVTWVNHDPEPYYNLLKDKPFTATAVYYKGKWYWYSSTTVDMLAEYGRYDSEEFDEAIECIAWQSLPEPWEGEAHE